MTVTITVRLNEEQIQKINKSGLTKSEYTRNAIDYFSENKMNANILAKVNIVDECIKLLQGYREELKNHIVSEAYQNLQLSYEIEENVRQSDENLYYKNEENVKKIYKNEENVRQDVLQSEPEVSDIYEENVRQMKENHYYEIYKPYLELLSKMLNLHNSVPDTTKKKITDETATKPSELNSFIFNFKEEIKQINYEISDEIIHHSYDEGNERKKL